MRVGKKKYKFLYCLRKWYKSNFSRWCGSYNTQCSFGIRAPFNKGNKCLNRWNLIKCGECWRADRLKLRRPLAKALQARDKEREERRNGTE